VHNQRSANSDHRRHDRLLVARFAAADSYAGEADAAQALVASCGECAALVSDIQVLSKAIGELPAPRRTRDFRLSPEQAERLHGSWLERLMRTLAAPSSAMLRPIAGVAMSIGLVLVVVGALPQTMPAQSGFEAGVPTVQDVEDAPPEDLQAPNTPANAPGTPANEPMGSVSATGGELTPATNDGPTTEMSASGDGRSSQVDGKDPDAVANVSPEPVTSTLDNAYLRASGEADGGVAAGDESLAQPFSVSRDMLLYAGILIAALSLTLLALIVMARRRYADPYLG